MGDRQMEFLTWRRIGSFQPPGSVRRQFAFALAWGITLGMVGARAEEAFRAQFESAPALIAFAPGRVNLIGEHTDTSEGFVFPCAIERGVGLAARPSAQTSFWYSSEEDRAGPFDVRSVEPGQVQGWLRYGAGVAWALREEGLEPPNLDVAIASDLPIASGLSSSAALSMAFMVAYRELLGLDWDGLRMARVCQRAENAFVGVQCGIMDPLASALGRAAHALFVDTRSLEVRYARVPDELSIVVCDTLKSRELAASVYNQRRDEVAQAAGALGVESLRDAQLEMLIDREGDMSPEAVRRARHVITENARCQSFYWALEDRNLLRIGMLMRASHESLREDFEVTGPELDTMAEACWTAPGCIGARMTGAGFGGCCVALVESERVPHFRRSVSNRYEARIGIQPRFYICKPADGARLVAGK